MSILDDKLTAIADLIRGIGPTGLDYVQALRMIAETAQSAQRQAVDQAREEGASWDQIGRALGITRQSAHERFSAGAS